MDSKINKYINASYKLYDTTDGENELLEETSAEQPFVFISGMGIVLDAFEKQVSNLEAGSKFDFTLAPEDAYGVHGDDRVVELDKNVFYIDGQFDEKNVYVDAVIPLQNEDGNMFSGQVIEITADKVRVDLNHPLAGRTLNFRGEILENREATNEEMAKFAEAISGNGHQCGCGGDCECGNSHEQGECCGKHKHHGEDESGCCGHHHGENGCCGKHHHDN